MKALYLERGFTFSIYLKNDEKAIEDFTKLLELNPNHKGAYLNRGLIYSGLENDRAIEDFSKCIDLYLDEIDFEGASFVYIVRGVTYRNIGNYQEALKDMNKSIELNPNSAFGYSNRGDTYYELEDFEKATKDWEKVIEIKSKGESDLWKKEIYEKINDAKEKLK